MVEVTSVVDDVEEVAVLVAWYVEALVTTDVVVELTVVVEGTLVVDVEAMLVVDVEAMLVVVVVAVGEVRLEVVVVSFVLRVETAG